MRMYLGAATAILFVATMVPALAQQSTATEKDRQGITELARKWAAAYNRKDAAGVAALYTEDAVEVAPIGIVEGRSAVQKRIEGEFQAGGHDLALSKWRVTMSGDMAFVAGEWNAQYGSQAAHGYFQSVNVRDGDTFKIHRNALNLALPETGPAQSASKAQ